MVNDSVAVSPSSSVADRVSSVGPTASGVCAEAAIVVHSHVQSTSAEPAILFMVFSPVPERS